VVEVLSASNTRANVEEKLEDYSTIQVQECWLVSPEGRTVEVLRYAAHGFERTELYGMGDVLLSAVLPELRVNVADILVETHKIPMRSRHRAPGPINSR
jgi:Uma2 family endonuclease